MIQTLTLSSLQIELILLNQSLNSIIHQLNLSNHDLDSIVDERK
jgi:hypothetical protein